MAFIRRRNGSNQLIETYREDGKVKQRVLANLGRHETIEAAIAHWERGLPIVERRLEEKRKHLAKAEEVVALRRSDPYERYERPPEHRSVPHRYPSDFDPKNAAENEKEAREWCERWGHADDAEWIEVFLTDERRKTLHQLTKEVASLTKFVATARQNLEALKTAAGRPPSASVRPPYIREGRTGQDA